ncbi:MAG: class I SAM-dependent methyltransferase [Lentisphaeraceae bacterium]|nr:class I SAM-dependent methyltransferase [Lentisphaeraceae bacterium]
MQIYNISIAYSNRILKENISGGRVLDVGGAAGTPLRANFLAEFADEVVIVDPASPRQVMNNSVSHVAVLVEDLDVNECGLFDHIVLSNVLEHMHQPQPALDTVAKLLKPCGSIHILTPNCESLNRRIGVHMGAMEHIRVIPPNEVAIGHVQTFTVSDMRNLIQQAGLKVRACQGVLLKPVPTPEMIEWPEERIKAFFDIAQEVPVELCHEVYFQAQKN